MPGFLLTLPHEDTLYNHFHKMYQVFRIVYVLYLVSKCKETEKKIF